MMMKNKELLSPVSHNVDKRANICDKIECEICSSSIYKTISSPPPPPPHTHTHHTTSFYVLTDFEEI